MKTCATNAHLGDCFWQCLLLHALGDSQDFYVPTHYVADLSLLVSGTNIHIHSNEQAPVDAQDCWIANARYEAIGVKYEHDTNIMQFVLRYLNAQAATNGYTAPFTTTEDLIACFPSLEPKGSDSGPDILVIDSNPLSGQCPGYSESHMADLVAKLDQRYKVSTVANRGLSLSSIGRIASRARLIVGVATGPWWPCGSIWAKDVPRMVMLNPIRLDFGLNNVTPKRHCHSVADLEEALREEGWL